MIKGPKAILASAISNALGEYFEVDSNKIESNLLSDAKIVLRQVNLKKQTTRLPINSAGYPTIITVTGCVEEVAFTWSWSVGDEQSWVRDAVLTITGLKFEARLEHGTKNDDILTTDDSDSGSSTHRDSFVDPATIDAASEKEIKKEPGGIAGFIAKQVRMIIDMLALKIVGFEFSVVLPPPLTATSMEGSSDSDASTVKNYRTLKVGGNEVALLSFGRDGQVENNGQQTNTGDKFSILRQRLRIESFYSSIVLESDIVTVAQPLIEPFSYSAEATRTGERFGGFATGLEVVGKQNVPSGDDLLDNGFVFHAGTTQMETLMQLGVMILVLPDETAAKDEEEEPEPEKHSYGSTIGRETLGGANVSSFTFALSSVSLVLFKDTKIIASALNMKYLADGTVCSVEAERLQYESSAGGRAEVLGVCLSMRPLVVLGINAIESVYLPDAFLLSKPIERPKISYEGETLSLRVDTIDGIIFSKKDDSTSYNEKDDVVNGEGTAPKANTSFAAPCRVDFSVQNVHLKKVSDGAVTQMTSFCAYAKPDKDTSSTQIAIRFDGFKSKLLHLTKVNLYASLPEYDTNEINALNFAAESAKVTAGHSTDEWTKEFEPKSIKAPKKAKSGASTADVKVPFANVAGLKITITWAGTGMKVKDTSLAIKPFKGKADTTAKDVINYYTKACLSRVPDFVNNAEVLGLNVVDSTAVTYGTWLGISTLGAGGGVAAITAVDGVKGAVAAGKRSRKVDGGEGWRPGDFMRGIVYSAGEATRAGAAKRGKEDGEGNAIDWAVGATSVTGQYVSTNKSRLGAAGAGGGGFFVGMALGGPVGGVIGGLVASAAGGKAIDTLEDKSNNEKNRAELSTVAEE